MSLFGAIILKKLYLNPEKADVEFLIIKNGIIWKIPAHKYILATGSEIFNAIFYSMEKVNVSIDNASEESLKQFLQIFYLNNLRFTIGAMDGVLHLADRFRVDEMFIVCSEFLRGHLSAENVCFVYELTIKYGEKMASRWFVHRFDYCGNECRVPIKWIFESIREMLGIIIVALQVQL